MKLKLWVAVAATLSLLSLPATAALQSIHWKTAGDNLVTLDTATGVEWLDLTQTDNKSYDQVSALLSTTYQGWRFPTQQEVFEMMSGHFAQITTDATYNVRTNTAEGSTKEMTTGKTFRSLFGHTYSYYQSGQDWSYASYGFYKNDDGQIVSSGFIRRNYWNGSYHTLHHNLLQPTISDNLPHVNMGWYLVNDGGVSLSSINDPMLNINNPDAPINQPPAGTVSVAELIAGTDFATASFSYAPAGVAGITGFKYRINGGAEQLTTSNVVSLIGLSANTTYTLEYAAYNNNGTGTWSSTSITTAPPANVSAPLGGLAGLAGWMLLAFRRRVGA